MFGAVKKENSIFNKDNTLFGGSIGGGPEGGSILPAGGLNLFGKNESKGGKDSDESDDDGGDEGDLGGCGGPHRKKRAKNKNGKCDAGGSVFGKVQRTGSGGIGTGKVKKDADKGSDVGRGSMGFRARVPMSTGNSKDKAGLTIGEVDKDAEKT